MALVCDTKSSNADTAPELAIEQLEVMNEDLEDGEIEDDDEEEAAAPLAPVVPETTEAENIVSNIPETNNTLPNQPTSPSNNKFSHVNRSSRYDNRVDRHIRYEDNRKRLHLTEAEKSVMHLHKLERLDREKREKYKRDQSTVVDDFASNIEKAIASILKKDKTKPDEDDNEEGDKRGKKRKKKDKEKRKAKQRKQESPIPEDFDSNDITNIKMSESLKIVSPNYSDSYDSNSSAERKLDHSNKKRSHSKTKDKRHNDKKHKSSNKNREQKTENQNKTTDGGICLFYLQGKCNMGDDCLYSHDVQVPMKLELCKFYVMECCAKGDNCSYMHSTFPCKFYHMGLPCRAGDSCKFAHGKPLNDGLKQILFKHIETAPKEILGEFPRLNRDGALSMLNQAQKALDVTYGGEKADIPGIPQLLEMNIPMPVDFIPNDNDLHLKDKKERHRPSRWQISEMAEQQSSLDMNFGLTGFYSECGDQDMRITSNGDIDMRTLPAQLSTLLQNVSASLLTDNQSMGDIDSRGLPPKDTDIRFEPPLHLLQSDNDRNAEESNLEIVTEEDVSADECVKSDLDFPSTLPKKQRELFLRIQSQQKDTLPDNHRSSASDEDKNIDWYSDDDDDGRLMIKDDLEETVKKTEEHIEPPQIPQDIKPVEVLEKLGDLSKIDISIEVTKLLSSLSQSSALAQQPKDMKTVVAAEPVLQKPDVKVQPVKPIQTTDPRKSKREANDVKKTEKISIYEQGSISLDSASRDVDLRNLDKDMDLRIGRDLEFRSTPGRPDVDLRHLALPFKPMQNYTPATEIDASIHSHLPFLWRVQLVDIPQPDYTGLKLSAHDAKTIGDPRLRKIFRLSIEEKESPASPKETVAAVPSPKAGSVRTDPRLRKVEEKSSPDNSSTQMNYAQQLVVLQTSAFYQSLSSSQKLLLNQELAERVDNSSTNANDPILNGILSNLGLISGNATAKPTLGSINTTANTNAVNILANVNNMLAQTQNKQFLNPIVNTLAQSIVQQTTNLGMANLASDFQLNFDPRQGGLLGNAPSFSYNENSNNYDDGGNFNDDYYEEPVIHNNNNRSVRGRGGRGGFRDRQHQNRRGRNFNNRHNNGNRNFRSRNRNNNRSRTPP